MARGYQLKPLVLTEAEREHLLGLSRRRTSAQLIACRARIVLAAADGKSNLEVADALSVSRLTVGKWRSRFLARRMDGLFDEPRPGAPRKVTDAHVERLITTALESMTKKRPVARLEWLRDHDQFNREDVPRAVRELAVAVKGRGAANLTAHSATARAAGPPSNSECAHQAAHV